MTAYNKKWYIKKNIVDYDAVSLYTSAMRRLNTVEDEPKPIPKDKMNMDFLKQQTAYIELIEIAKINKHYTFPLTRLGYYCSAYDDQLKDGETRLDVVCDIELEDLINFQQIEFNIINVLNIVEIGTKKKDVKQIKYNYMMIRTLRIKLKGYEIIIILIKKIIFIKFNYEIKCIKYKYH